MPAMMPERRQHLPAIGLRTGMPQPDNRSALRDAATRAK